jgi:tRNA-Thr(GGU) m(6)t(6)A37 methyltransferase TsaA
MRDLEAMSITFMPIGYVETEVQQLPRHCTVSDVEGTLVIDKEYAEGLRDIKQGDRIAVIFHFHKSPPFSPDLLIQKPRSRNEKKGVFSICTPRRPNPIGLSVLEVCDRKQNILHVKGLDMMHGTPILDIKPYVDMPAK